MSEHEARAARPTDGGQPVEDAATLAAAEEQAAREAAEEHAKGPKVVRATARTSRKSSAAANRPEGAPATDGAVTATGTLAVTPADVSAETVVIRQAGAQAVNATNVDLVQGGIGRARATDIAVSQGGIGAARGDRVSVEIGAIGVAMGGEVRLTQGAAGAVLAREARVEQAVVRTLVANEVTVERTTGVLVLIARRVEGDVRTVLDWRGALAFGAAFGALVGLLRRRK